MSVLEFGLHSAIATLFMYMFIRLYINALLSACNFRIFQIPNNENSSSNGCCLLWNLWLEFMSPYSIVDMHSILRDKKVEFWWMRFIHRKYLFRNLINWKSRRPSRTRNKLKCWFHMRKQMSNIKPTATYADICHIFDVKSTFSQTGRASRLYVSRNSALYS